MCFPNITGTGMSSTDLANHILEKAGVALLPGSSFGSYGEGYLRLSYANSIENIQRGLEKIRAVLSATRKETARENHLALKSSVRKK